MIYNNNHKNNNKTRDLRCSPTLVIQVLQATNNIVDSCQTCSFLRPMASQKRIKGVSVDRAIVYGSVAAQLPKRTDTQHTHRWSVYVTGAHHEDISYFVRKVTFKLHESFANPLRGNTMVIVVSIKGLYWWEGLSFHRHFYSGSRGQTAFRSDRNRLGGIRDPDQNILY
jgi:hypothetical protein